MLNDLYSLAGTGRHNYRGKKKTKVLFTDS
jgi:hypothetical protein